VNSFKNFYLEQDNLDISRLYLILVLQVELKPNLISPEEFSSRNLYNINSTPIAPRYILSKIIYLYGIFNNTASYIDSLSAILLADLKQ